MDTRSQHRQGDAAGTRTLRSCLDEDQALAYAIARASNTIPEELARHVDGCARCQALVAEAARAQFASEASVTGEQARTLRDGEVVLGRYEIVRFIGAGGMGEVYEALDRELGERIALKTVALTTLDNQRAVARLKAEVQLARRTTHPNVCRIFDFAVYMRVRPGLGAEAIPLLTMELLSGETLAAYLRRTGRLTVEQARPIVRQILTGLAAVHAAQIVHRDLKAENVFLVDGVGGPRVVLMDFGLARNAFPSGAASFSVHHTLVGTASYMAPEQVEGRPVSFASDVYALGVLMFELVTGQLPFVGETAMRVAMARLTQPPPRPTSLVPGLDPRWEEAILRCLARAPVGRFPTVAALAAAIDESAAPPPRPRRRRLWLAGVTGGALAALLVGPRLLHPPVPAAPPPPAPAQVTPPVTRSPAPTIVVEPPPAAAPEEPARPQRSRHTRPRRHEVAKATPAPVEAAPPAAPKPAPALPDPDGIINPFSTER